MAATAVFAYAWLVPAALYAVLWWIGGSKSANKTDSTSASFLELLCVYGYSLAIYIPVSVLWTIQYSAFQWSLVLAGAGLSGAVLVLAIWPSVRDHANKVGILLIGIVLVLHILLACGFMLYFFHVPATSAMVDNNNDTKSAGTSFSTEHHAQNLIKDATKQGQIEANKKISKDTNPKGGPDIMNSAIDSGKPNKVKAK